MTNISENQAEVSKATSLNSKKCFDNSHYPFSKLAFTACTLPIAAQLKKTTWKIFVPDNTAGQGLAATSCNQHASRAKVTEIITKHALQCSLNSFIKQSAKESKSAMNSKFL